MNTPEDLANDVLYLEPRHHVIQCENCDSTDIEVSQYKRQNPDGTWPNYWHDDPTMLCADCGSTTLETVILSDKDIEESQK